MTICTFLACAAVLGATGPASPACPAVPRQAEAVLSPPLRAELSAGAPATLRAWVFLTDKYVGDAAEIHAALAVRRDQLSPRTLLRRQRRGRAPHPPDLRDLPPAPQYVAAIAATGARIRVASRWLNAVSVDAAPDQLRAIARLPFVRLIHRVARAAPRPPLPTRPLNADGAAPEGDPGWYGFAYDQLSQIGIVAAHDAGYTAAGIVIGILDTGFLRTHVCFNQTTPPAHPVQVLGEFDFINDDANTGPEPGDDGGQHAHGTYILGTLAAYLPGVLVGATPDAQFLLAKTEDITQEVPIEEDHYVAGLEWIEASGGDLATSSLGYIDWYQPSDLNGQTAVTTIAVNVATELGLVCCTAAGNGGNDSDPDTLHLIAPADAYRVLTCGAVGSDGAITGFSSDGPSFDGRVKPEVLARGLDTVTVSAFSDTALVAASGTSLSTPLVAGAAALIVQAHPDWSVDKVRRALFHTAADFAAASQPDPLFVRGYGVIDAMAAIQFVHGDVNGDGTPDADDVQPFLDALAGMNPDADQTRRADVDASGAVTPDDVPIFVADLLN